MNEKDIVKGLKYFDRYGGWRVMAVAEGYAMVRRTGCYPTLFTVKDLVKAFNSQSLLIDKPVKWSER